MDNKLAFIEDIFRNTAYIRTGGSKEEYECAEYLKGTFESLGLSADLEPFEVDMGDVTSASLTVDGEDIPCVGYMLCGSGSVTAPLYYLRDDDDYSFSLCRGKIALVEGFMPYKKYRSLIDNGAVGVVTFSGNIHYPDSDIDKKELRPYVSKGDKLLCVNINVKDAVRIIKCDGKTATVSVEQNEYKTSSHNVTAYLEGEYDKDIVLTAHYDSTALSTGAYDNMSGCVGLFLIAEYFKSHPHKYGLKFILCGSEERGLLGSKAYVEREKESLDRVVLCVNLDMIGCTMGYFLACCTSEESLVTYLKYMGMEKGLPVHAYQGVYSSDSTPFADNGIPAVSFARITSRETANIHTRYDTYELMKNEMVASDADFIIEFVDRMANSVYMPVKREMPQKMKDKLDEYLNRK